MQHLPVWLDCERSSLQKLPDAMARPRGRLVMALAGCGTGVATGESMIAHRNLPALNGSAGSQSAKGASTDLSVIRVSQLMALPVIDASGEHLGRVVDIHIEVGRGLIAYLELQWDDWQVLAVPFEAIRFELDRNVVQVMMARQALERGLAEEQRNQTPAARMRP